MIRVPLEQILELPVPQRLELAQQIWESVFEQTEDVPLTAGQRAELERRWLALQENPDEGEAWEDVKQLLLDE